MEAQSVNPLVNSLGSDSEWCINCVASQCLRVDMNMHPQA